MSFSAMGAVDGGVIMVFLYVNGPCEEVKVQADDTVYTFDTALQAILLDSSGVGLMLRRKWSRSSGRWPPPKKSTCA